MVSRRYLRIKTMQALYAHGIKPYEEIQVAENELIANIKNCYQLFLWFFSILPEIAFYRVKKMEDLKSKHNPTYEDLHPNTKFIDNQIIHQIEDNLTLKKLFPRYHINWSEDTDVIIMLFHAMEEMDCYKKYMSKKDSSYEEDKQLIFNIIEQLFAENEHLRWFFGEKNPHWIDDYEEALAMFYKNIEDFKLSKGDDCKINGLFKNRIDDEEFCRSLFRKTIENDAIYQKMIEEKLQNWEADRVIGMDMLLMKMAICELLNFPTIPVKVTMNEYIDLAKYYSSDKSKVFVNGILDKLIVDFRDQEMLCKTGRGLFQN